MSKRELRAPKKKCFRLEYQTVQNVLDNLTDAELGEYFKAICNYELYGEEPDEFSDRAVQMMFRVTCRELDYQLDKHHANQERGSENRNGKGKDAVTEEAAATDLASVLTAEDIEALEAKFSCTDALLDEIQEQLNANKTEVKNPRRYIEKYARETGWNERIKEEINNIALGIFDKT